MACWCLDFKIESVKKSMKKNSNYAREKSEINKYEKINSISKISIGVHDFMKYCNNSLLYAEPLYLHIFIRKIEWKSGDYSRN